MSKEQVNALSFQILDNEMGKRLDGRLFKNFAYLRTLTITVMAILIHASYKNPTFWTRAWTEDC
jgi:hypothetical protein